MTTTNVSHSPSVTGRGPPPTPLFTVVLLGFQCAPYLAKALSSVEAQGGSDFDVMCLVEESSDESLAICREWAERHRNARVVSLPKSGSGAASRNYAIDHAAGRYLVFLDGDDWIGPGMLERLAAKLAETGEVDVLAFVLADTESEDIDLARARKATNFTEKDASEVFTGPEAIRRAGRNGGRFHGHSPLNIYRTAFLRENHLHQPDGLLLEDIEWMVRVWYSARRFAYLPETLYVYRRRPHSTTTEHSTRIVHHLALNFRSVLAFAEARGAPRDIRAIWANQWLALLCWFLFHPVTSRKISDADRQRALAVLFGNGGCRAFLRFARLASFSKRLAIPFLFLAAGGFSFPGKCFFRGIYYPLSSRRR